MDASELAKSAPAFADATSVAPGRCFRDAMAQVASSVAVITVMDGGEVHGITVSSLISLSVEPPMILLSLRAGSQMLTRIYYQKAFGVTVLAEDQEDIARLCADPARAALPRSILAMTAAGVPTIADACAHLEVLPAAHLPVADHVTLFGLVFGAEHSDKRPLLYHRRQYRRLDQAS